MCQSQLVYYDQYSLIGWYIGICLIISFVLVSVVVGWGAGYRGISEVESQYECGFIPFDKIHTKFDVNFFLVGLLFLFFDLEVVFLLSWGVNVGNCDGIGLVGGMIFLVLLGYSFIYEVMVGVLEPESL